MSDLAVVALAAAAWLGSLVAAPVPRLPALALVLAAVLVRRPWLLVVATALLASSFAAVAWRGLEPPTAGARVHGDAVLVSDPERVAHATRVEVRLGRRRVEAWARGIAATALDDRLAGDVVVVDGRLREVGRARARLAVRHISAGLDVTAVVSWRPGAPAGRVANAVRRTLTRGAQSLRPDRRALLAGFLLGDQREISPAVESDFRGAGLTHLLAVSGQNLSFLLAAAGPALRRMRLRARFVASLSLIALFAVMTRAEPSVLRASAMASIACWSAFAGQPVARVRTIGLAVAALLLVDPMLARSVGFQLSVGASLGLVTLAAPIAARLRGPRWLAEPLAVTLAAQVGVAPILLTTFGGMPVITPIANLLAVPVAGPLTAWGLGAGLAAGVIGEPIAALLHVPTNAMVGWIATVAHASARLPLGTVDVPDVLIGIVVAAVVVSWRRVAVPLVAVALVVIALPPRGTLQDVELARGVHLWRAGAVVLVIDGSATSAPVLDGLRRAGVGVVDLVVARRGSKDVAALVADIRSRHPIRSIAAPGGHRIRDATAITADITVHAGRLVVRLTPDDGALDVRL